MHPTNESIECENVDGFPRGRAMNRLYFSRGERTIPGVPIQTRMWPRKPLTSGSASHYCQGSAIPSFLVGSFIRDDMSQSRVA